MNVFTLVTPITILFSAIGLTFIFKTFLENLVAGLIVRGSGSLKKDVRVKIVTSPYVIKGDLVSVGPIRTTLVEVGDGEHLPSIRTGRLVKVPNTMLVSNPIVLYGETIVDEVIAEVKLEGVRVDSTIGAMRRAIEAQGHKVREVAIYQKGDHLVVHGVFESQTRSATDERGRVLREFLTKLNAEELAGTTKPTLVSPAA
jgi:hypothetical protein